MGVILVGKSILIGFSAFKGLKTRFLETLKIEFPDRLPMDQPSNLKISILGWSRLRATWGWRAQICATHFTRGYA